jgi:SEC-C motif-containing protein
LRTSPTGMGAILLVSLLLISSTHALVAPIRHGAVVMKKGKKSQVPARPASSGKGFGAKPAAAAKPTLEEVIMGFETRLPADTSVPCACCSGIAYADCCRPYHLGVRVPETPTRTLQTRFSAFAYRLPAHLIRTTSPTNRDYREDHVAWARWMNREGMFDGFRFEKLEAEPEEAGRNADEAFVAFRATLLPRDGGGAPQSFLERSQFLFDAEAGWLYGQGEVRSDDSFFELQEGAAADMIEAARRSRAPGADPEGPIIDV